MNENGNIRVRVLISGNVQTVGFRFFTKDNANKLKLTGWVQNLDGINEPDEEISLVEAVFQGTPANVDEMRDRCKKGNGYSGGTKVKELHRYPLKDDENSFTIIRKEKEIKGD